MHSNPVHLYPVSSFSHFPLPPPPPPISLTSSSTPLNPLAPGLSVSCSCLPHSIWGRTPGHSTSEWSYEKTLFFPSHHSNHDIYDNQAKLWSSYVLWLLKVSYRHLWGRLHSRDSLPDGCWYRATFIQHPYFVLVLSIFILMVLTHWYNQSLRQYRSKGRQPSLRSKVLINSLPE